MRNVRDDPRDPHPKKHADLPRPLAALDRDLGLLEVRFGLTFLRAEERGIDLGGISPAWTRELKSALIRSMVPGTWVPTSAFRVYGGVTRRWRRNSGARLDSGLPGRLKCCVFPT